MLVGEPPLSRPDLAEREEGRYRRDREHSRTAAAHALSEQERGEQREAPGHADVVVGDRSQRASEVRRRQHVEHHEDGQDERHLRPPALGPHTPAAERRAALSQEQGSAEQQRQG